MSNVSFKVFVVVVNDSGSSPILDTGISYSLPVTTFCSLFPVQKAPYIDIELVDNIVSYSVHEVRCGYVRSYCPRMYDMYGVACKSLFPFLRSRP